MSMEQTVCCDYLVVGSGISGMTLSLLLAECGFRVLLLEKSAVIGGSMQRFHRNGIPFDTGFHFTAGLTGCMGDMFRMLNLAGRMEEIPIRTRLRLESRGVEIHLPRGREAVKECLVGRYPAHAESIRAYFKREKEIFDNTALFNLRDGGGFSAMLFQDADFIPLADYLKTLNLPAELEMILGSFASCYGTPPSEASLASHCRVSYGLLDNMVRIRGGGGVFVEEFLKRAKELGIDIRRSCTIRSCLEIERKICKKVQLTDGSTVTFRNCIMTIHPKAIASLLPASVQSADFRKRINEFEEGCGFFTIFGVLDPPLESFTQELTSCLNTDSIGKIMDPAHPEATATGIMLTVEKDRNGNPRQTVTAFESVYPEETRAWEQTTRGKRGEDYQRYKREKAETIRTKIERIYPAFKGHLHILDAASMLTYRDYLSPFGSAYGVRQKTGQHNLFGKLPIRNFYAAGQNALLPGAMGAMLSSFIIWRKLIGEEMYRRALKKHLGEEERKSSS